MADDKKGGKQPQSSPRTYSKNSSTGSANSIKVLIVRSKGPSGGKANKK